MKTGLLCLLLTGSLIAQPTPAGVWQGELKTPGGTLRLRLNLAAAMTGWRATLDSLDQNAMGIAVEDVRFIENKLTWKIPTLGASYEGTLNGETLTGEFSQSGLKFPLLLTRGATAAEPPKRPQTPKPPFPYRSEEVEFASKAAGIMLAGTLTTPPGEGPHPALILITGSGPQDRNETMAGHQPFAVIADYLSRRGVVVLRYDDRGVGKSTGSFRGSTSADFASDAEGAFEYLRHRPGVGIAGIAGHSEGGTIAPMVAARRTDVDFVVLLAGTGGTGQEVLFAQAAALARTAGAPAAAIAANRELQAALFELARTKASPQEILAQAREKLGASPVVEQGAKQVSEPWFRAFLAYDPAPVLAKVKCPVLVLNGDLDLQVLAEQNVPAIANALRRGGNTKVTVQRFPKLNHLFQTATKGMPAEYSQIEETIAPVVLETIAEWVVKVRK